MAPISDAIRVKAPSKEMVNNMIAYISPLNTITISQVVKRILNSGKITYADEKFFLRAMVAAEPLTIEEIEQVSTVMNRLQMGLLKVVD